MEENYYGFFFVNMFLMVLINLLSYHFQEKKRKYEPPVPTRVGKKKKRTKGPDAATKLPQGTLSYINNIMERLSLDGSSGSNIQIQISINQLYLWLVAVKFAVMLHLMAVSVFVNKQLQYLVLRSYRQTAVRLEIAVSVSNHFI